MKIQYYLILIISLICSLSVVTKAQQIKLDQLEFKSKYEQQVFQNHKSASSLELLLAISPEMDTNIAIRVKQDLKDFENELKLKKFETKKEAKKIKILFDLTHSSFLEKYEEVVNFGEIFNTKLFNCVSGSGLYALILDNFNIPYVIKESPTHVYVVVNPNSSHIVLETTSPEYGFMTISDKDIQTVVNELVTSKYISQSEVETLGYKAAYNTFFYSEEAISLKKLASLQYYNESLKFIEEEDYSNALNSIYKAEYLYSTKSYAYFIESLLEENIKTNTLKDLDEVTSMVEYSNFTHKNTNYILSLYKSKLYDKLLIDGDLKFADSMTNYFTMNINDTALNQSIQHSNYFIKSGYYELQYEWDKALQLAELGLNIKPNDLQLQTVVVKCVALKHTKANINPETLTELMGYSTRFPFLNTNLKFNNLLLDCYGLLTFNTFFEKKITKSLTYLSSAEKILDQFPNKLSFNEKGLASAYIMFCEYYFQNNQYKKGSDFIKKGLTYLPTNTKLLEKKNILVRAGYY